MKIAVCVKQIPAPDQVHFERNRLVREGVDLVVNPADLLALGQALDLRDAVGGEVVVLTMGPPSGRAALEDALRRGADRAVHLLDQRFAGADTLATARALARALRREEPDVVLLGRSSLDGATAQVGPQVAELLDLPQVTEVASLAVEAGAVTVTRETEHGEETWEAATPVVLCVTQGPEPAAPGPGAAEAVEEVGLDELGGAPTEYGTRGSPTAVREVREMPRERDGRRSDDPREGARRVLGLHTALEREAPWPETPEGERRRALWVLAQRHGSGLHPTTLEGLACARDVAGAVGAEVVAVLPCAEAGELPAQLAAHGADRVLVVRHPDLAEYSTERFAEALCAALAAHEPIGVVAPWSAEGRDYVPRAAARLGLGLTGDFVRLEVDRRAGHDPELHWVKPAWAGMVEAPILAHRSPAVGTLRPGAFRPLAARTEAEPAVEELEPELSGAEVPRCTHRGDELDEGPLLDHAAVVVLAGADLEDVAPARALAEALDGAVGATASAVRAGLLPSRLEVSVTRRSLAAPLVVALGVREAEELDAVRTAGRVVTVHPDPDASAHERADLAVVAEPGDLVAAARDPELTPAEAPAPGARRGGPPPERRTDGVDPTVNGNGGRPDVTVAREPAPDDEGVPVEHADVVIVGGRVAGCACAVPLARAGRRVVSIDRARFPAKTLSTHGCMSGHTVEFARMGALEALLELGPPKLEWIVVNDERHRIKDRMPTVDGYDFGLCIKREEMDVVLRETARDAGADMREGTQVSRLLWERGRVVGVRCRELTSKREYEIRAELVVGADGRISSLVADQVGAGEPYRTSQNGRGFAFWYMDDPKVGTFYHHALNLNRIGNAHALCVGMPNGRMIAIHMGRPEIVERMREDPERMWRWWLEHNPGLAWRVEGATGFEGPSTTNQLTSFYRASTGPGWALAGDAGHFKDPYIGQGIRDGLRYSRLLGERAAVLLDDPALLDRGLREWERERDTDTLPSYHWANQETRVDPEGDPLVSEALRYFSHRSDSEFSLPFSRLKPEHEVMHPGRAARFLGRALLQPGVRRGPLLRFAARRARADLDIRRERRRAELRSTRRMASEVPVEREVSAR